MTTIHGAIEEIKGLIKNRSLLSARKQLEELEQGLNKAIADTKQKFKLLKCDWREIIMNEEFDKIWGEKNED